MKIGIIAAVPEEIQSIHQDLEFYEKINHAEREFYLGKFNNIELVLVICKVGKVAASITACALIEKFNVDKIIMTGLAGAVSHDLNRGDIVLSTGTYQHDLDARPLCEKQFEVPLTNRRIFESKSEDFQLAQIAIKHFLEKIDHYVDHDERVRLKVAKPRLHTGIIATGDIFIEDIDQQINLTIDSTQALAVEMEGAAIAQVCAEHHVPYILFRTISDKANESAHVSLTDFSVKIASHYASGMVQEILKLLSEN